MSGYIGILPVPQATETRNSFTATSNQTSFATDGYTPNFVSVYLNGVLLSAADYTATNGTDVVLASGAAADDVVEIISFSTFDVSARTFTGDVTASGGTFLPTGDTSAGDNAAVGYASADGLVLTGQGSTSDVTIKNDADATVMSILTGTTGATFAGDVIVPDGDLILGSTAVTTTAAEINLIDGGTARGTTTIVDADGVLVNDAGTMRMTTMATLATYMGTKIGGGGLAFIASSGAISNAATVAFTGFDASAYDHYKFYLQHVVPVTDGANLEANASTNGGSSYDTTDGNYLHDEATTTGFRLGTNVGSAANEFGCSGEFNIFAPHSTSYTYTSTLVVTTNANGGLSFPGTQSRNIEMVTIHTQAQDTDAVQFRFSSGNIETGEITMFGIVNS